jgi:TDG/mug DNA glycosylase family protein
MALRDILVARPRILFVGINPGLRSDQLGHHFAGRGNPFWRLLHAAGLTPVLLDPSEDRRLAEFGLALTNLVARPTRSAAELDRDELRAGREVLSKKAARLEPAVLALVGVTLYRQVFPKPLGGPGAGAKPERLHDARVFVVPNPSGLNAAYPGFQHKLVWFQALRQFADEVTQTRALARRPSSTCGSR